MHIVKFILFFCFLNLAAHAQTKEMTPAEITAFKTEIAHRAGSYKTISGKFLQKKHLSFLANDIQSSGNFFFSAPDKIKWAYEKPYPYSVVFKNNTLYIDDAGKKSNVDLSSNELFGKLNSLIASSINGEMLSNEEFNTSYTQNESVYRAHLLPTNSVVLKLFKEIVLSFDKEDFSIEEVKLIGPSGDYTQIIFKELKINTAIDESVFEQ